MVFCLVHDEARRRAVEAVRTAPNGYGVTVQPRTRTLDQNAKLWACLSEIAGSVEWYGRYLSAEEWKHIFSAALKKSEVVPGLDGGFVVLGQSTSRMSTKEMSDMLEIIHAFAAERGIEL